MGGIQSVTLGDQEARYRGTQKTVLERKAPPTFDVVVEIQSWEQVAVHDGVAQVVDQWLRGYPIVPVIRSLDGEGEVIEREGDPRPNADPPAPWDQEFGGRNQDYGNPGPPFRPPAGQGTGPANDPTLQPSVSIPAGVTWTTEATTKPRKNRKWSRPGSSARTGPAP